jgi:hypothetical protein
VSTVPGYPSMDASAKNSRSPRAYAGVSYDEMVETVVRTRTNTQL